MKLLKIKNFFVSSLCVAMFAVGLIGGVVFTQHVQVVSGQSGAETGDGPDSGPEGSPGASGAEEGSKTGNDRYDVIETLAPTCTTGAPYVTHLVPGSCREVTTGGGDNAVTSQQCEYETTMCPTMTDSCVSNQGAACSTIANSCGATNSGVIECSGACSVITPPSNASCPVISQSCISSSNSCGMTNSGIIGSSGTCSVVTPSESLCPTAQPPISCTTAANSCGMTNSGTVQTNGSCSASVPSNSLCTTTETPIACTSPANSCGMTNSGQVQSNGLCSATTPNESQCPQVDPGLCYADPDNVSVYGDTPAHTVYAHYPQPLPAGYRVIFPTWSESNGQDDIVWYSGTDLGNGTWSAAIDFARHPEVGPFATHAYAVSSSGNSTFCDSANFTRNGELTPEQCVSEQGNACSTAANICGMTAIGNIRCDGSCSTAVVPSDGYCTTTGPGSTGPGQTGQNTGGGVGGTGGGNGGGSCNAQYGSTCTTAANSCGMTNSGIAQCDGSCSIASPPSDASCPVPTITVTTQPQLIQRGGTCTVRWSSTNAIACSIRGPGVNQTGSTSGSVTTPALTGQAIYTVTCTNGTVVSNSTTGSCNINPRFNEI